MFGNPDHDVSPAASSEAAAPEAMAAFVSRRAPSLVTAAAIGFAGLALIAHALGQSRHPAVMFASVVVLPVWAAVISRPAVRGRRRIVIHGTCALMLVALAGLDRSGGPAAAVPSIALVPALIAALMGSWRAAAGYAAGGLAVTLATLAPVPPAEHSLGAIGTAWQAAGIGISYAMTVGALLTVAGVSRHGLAAARAALARNADEMAERAEAVAAAAQDMLGMLLAALDARGVETAAHALRVSRTAFEIAEDMGVAGEELEAIRRAALLHDVGAIGVPDALLLKAGALDEQEWLVMRRHAETGYRLLADLPFLAPEAEIVYAHHERWDGHGYPRGLLGDEIPLGARIVAVVDAYDAITHDRPYRSARGTEEALAVILTESGAQFDPAVVDAFLARHRGRPDDAVALGAA